MSPRITFGYVLVSFVFFNLCFAAAKSPVDTCIKFKHDDFNEMCAPFFSEVNLNSIRILLPANATKKELIYNATLATEPIKLASPDDCRVASLALTCASKYQVCSTIKNANGTFHFPIPRSICMKLCKRVTSRCEGTQGPLPNCTATIPGTGDLVFPKNGTFVPLDGSNSTTFVPCWDYQGLEESPNFIPFFQKKKHPGILNQIF
jgi:hypothetical protein